MDDPGSRAGNRPEIRNPGKAARIHHESGAGRFRPALESIVFPTRHPPQTDSPRQPARGDRVAGGEAGIRTRGAPDRTHLISNQAL